MKVSSCYVGLVDMHTKTEDGEKRTRMNDFNQGSEDEREKEINEKRKKKLDVM